VTPGDDRHVLTLPHPARAHAAAWSPDGRRLATACADRLVREWDTATGMLLGSFAGHADDVNWVAWSRDGSRVASASSDGTVRLWRPADGWSSSELTGPVGQVWEVVFSPDGTREGIRPALGEGLAAARILGRAAAPSERQGQGDEQPANDDRGGVFMEPAAAGNTSLVRHRIDSGKMEP
jgi:dipeptidyl aminopeptidase/acylaminoacyl peptidase